MFMSLCKAGSRFFVLSSIVLSFAFSSVTARRRSLKPRLHPIQSSVRDQTKIENTYTLSNLPIPQNATSEALTRNDARNRNANHNKNENHPEATIENSPLTASVNASQTVTQEQTALQKCAAFNTDINGGGAIATPVQAINFLFAYSNQTQNFAGATFAPVTFNNVVLNDGWTVTANQNFSPPATGLYLVTITANIRNEEVDGADDPRVGVQAFFGPLGSEVALPGTDMGAQSDTGTSFTTATKTFLLQAIAGQNLLIQAIADGGNNPRLAPINLPGQITTTASITITRIN